MTIEKVVPALLYGKQVLWPSDSHGEMTDCRGQMTGDTDSHTKT